VSVVTRLRILAEAVIVALVWALLNRAASLFEVRPGLAFFFPAAAVTLAAGVRLRWAAVPAVMLATFLLPWGLARTFTETLLFSFPAGLWAAALALWRLGEGSSWARLWRMTWFGVAGGAALAAIPGAALITVLLGPVTWAAFTSYALHWWVPDAVAALVFGLPLLVVLAPASLMDGDDQALFRRWAGDWRQWALALPLAVGAVAACRGLAAVTSGSVHWFVGLLALPVVLVALRGGVGAALVINGVVSVGYLALAMATGLRAGVAVQEWLAPTYANLLLLTGFAVLGGIQAGRQRLFSSLARQRAEELGRGLEATVRALAAAIEVKDSHTDRHLQRVERLAVLIGRELNMGEEELTVLRRAAILHDVGKIGVPEQVLNKVGALTEEELAQLQRHVDLGIEILAPVEFLKPVLEVVKYHQERWDGDRRARYPGYHGLRGEEIPIGARIIAVADAYDAMTHDRPYRPAMSREEARAELWRCAGSQFDPMVVAAAIRVLDRTAGDISGDSRYLV
jgi:hypothetical protein